MSPSIGVNLRVTGHSHQGGRKYMEDIFSVAYQSTPDENDLEYAFFGIFDGHGGREAAQFAKDNLMDSIVKQKLFWSDRDEDVLKAIKDGFVNTHHAMWGVLETWPRTASGLPSTSGTTASVVFLRRGRIYLGHVGDSSIVLGQSENREDEWKAVALTNDHKPESEEETQRIMKAGGKVVTKVGVPRVVWNRPKPGHKGPIRRSTPFDEVPFLAVARALGDLWSHNQENDMFVVSPVPDVQVLTADPLRHRCLILGTDGLWNVTSPQMAVQIVQETEHFNETCYEESQEAWINPSHCLVERALVQWNNLKMRADNTSVVTLLFDPPGPPRFQHLRQSRLNRTSSQSNATVESRPVALRKLSEVATPESGMVCEVANMLQAKSKAPSSEPSSPAENNCCPARTKEAAVAPPTSPQSVSSTRNQARSTRETTPEDGKGKKRWIPSPATIPTKKRSILGENRVLQVGSSKIPGSGRTSRLLHSIPIAKRQSNALAKRELRSNTLPPRRRVPPAQLGK